MRTLQQRIYHPADPFPVKNVSALWTAGAVLVALVAIVILFFWAFATQAY